ncbi:MAG: hypothetical protein AAF617_06015 [Bacteroidota bacterium]
MNSRLFFYIFILSICISCGSKEEQKESSNTTTATAEKQAEDTTTTTKTLTLDDKISAIKTNFSAIESQLSSYEKKAATEEVGGGFLEKEGYFSSGVPRKVKFGSMGEHGSIVRTFYLHANELFFVFEQEYSEASMNGPFTSKEKRYYIHEDELIRVLEKEKTVKSGEVDMSTVQNVDVTDQWKSKQAIVAEFKTELRETATSLITTKVVGLDNGRWMSTDDEKSGLEVKDGKIIMFYKGIEIGPENVFSYELYEEEGVEYLRLQNDKEEMVYGLLEYSDETMMLSYLGSGNTLTYRKEK